VGAWHCGRDMGCRRAQAVDIVKNADRQADDKGFFTSKNTGGYLTNFSWNLELQKSVPEHDKCQA
jgi:hypothetical protein